MLREEWPAVKERLGKSCASTEPVVINLGGGKTAVLARVGENDVGVIQKEGTTLRFKKIPLENLPADCVS